MEHVPQRKIKSKLSFYILPVGYKQNTFLKSFSFDVVCCDDKANRHACTLVYSLCFYCPLHGKLSIVHQKCLHNQTSSNLNCKIFRALCLDWASGFLKKYSFELLRQTPNGLRFFIRLQYFLLCTISSGQKYLQARTKGSSSKPLATSWLSERSLQLCEHVLHCDAWEKLLSGLFMGLFFTGAMKYPLLLLCISDDDAMLRNFIFVLLLLSFSVLIDGVNV